MNCDLDPQSTQSILSFWGKARANNQAGSPTHSIAYHSMDVAAVGAQLISRDRDRMPRIAAAVGMKVDTLTSVLPFLLSLHDIGKYARVFQAKSLNHWPSNSLGPYRQIAAGNSHVITGFQMLVRFSDAGPVQHVFETVMPGWSASERKILFRALAGHHGRPPDEGERPSFGPHDVCAACVEAAQTHINVMFTLMQPTALPRCSSSRVRFRVPRTRRDEPRRNDCHLPRFIPARAGNAHSRSRARSPRMWGTLHILSFERRDSRFYDDDTRSRQVNVGQFDKRLRRLNEFWGGKMLSEVTGETCREYARIRGSDGGARRDLEDLRAAINHHAAEGYHRAIVRVILPPKGLARDRWLTRNEAAQLLWACLHIGRRKSAIGGRTRAYVVLAGTRSDSRRP